MRKVIAKRLGQSKFSAPHYYLSVEFDMTNAISFRNQYNSIPDTKVSFNDIVVKAASMALIDSPKVNSQWFEDRIRYNKHVHIGVAVVVDDGLITEFKEKPMMKLQLSECLGIYMLGKEIIQRIKKKKKKQVNLSFDILQELAKEGKISAHDIEQREWIDAESPMILERNEKLVTKIIKQMGL